MGRAFRKGHHCCSAKAWLVHGRFGAPCHGVPATECRIIYAENETNYCPRCQTKGKLLADRSLSRLLKDDWPATIEELEERRRK